MLTLSGFCFVFLLYVHNSSSSEIWSKLLSKTEKKILGVLFYKYSLLYLLHYFRQRVCKNNNLNMFRDDGQAVYTATVPDTITSWITTAFAVHDDDGLGVSPEAAKVTFQKIYL